MESESAKVLAQGPSENVTSTVIRVISGLSHTYVCEPEPEPSQAKPSQSAGRESLPLEGKDASKVRCVPGVDS